MRRQGLNEKELTLFSYFSDLEDPRSAQGKRHIFFDMICLAICAVLCGADSWVGVENFGNAQLSWFQSFLELPQDIPSHDAFSDLFQKIDPGKFQKAFIVWTQEISATLDQAIVNIDGKTLRKSFNSRKGIKAMHSVSAFCTENKLILGQVKTKEKSNEITAVPELLKLLLLKGCIVTVDALGCQTEIAEEIIENGAEYVQQLKKIS